MTRVRGSLGRLAPGCRVLGALGFKGLELLRGLGFWPFELLGSLGFRGLELLRGLGFRVYGDSLVPFWGLGVSRLLERGSYKGLSEGFLQGSP